MTDVAPTNSRRYRGIDGHERLRQRREALVEAGFELFGTLGYNDSTIEALCERAGLGNKRYFYESFPDRQALLAAVYETQIQSLQQELLEALADPGLTIQQQIQTGVTVFVRSLIADIRKARILFIEVHAAGPVLRDRGLQAIRDFAALVLAILTGRHGIPSTKRDELGALALMGAFRQLIVAWSTDPDGTDVDELVDVCITYFTMVYDRYLLEHDLPRPT